MFDVDPIDLLARELLRERTPALIAEACAWSVGLSDKPYLVRRHGRIVATGLTIGARAAGEQDLGAEEDARLELGDARPGSFQDALNALTPDGRLYADRFAEQVLSPFVLDTCVRAAERAQHTRPGAWAELADELGEDADDLVAVVRAAEWQAPLETEAEQLVVAALGDVPLVEVEGEGLPLSIVRAAEAEARAAAGGAGGAGSADPEPAPSDDDLAGALFLAEAAIGEAGLPVPVVAGQADELVRALLAQGIEPDEVPPLLPHLPVHADTAERVLAWLDRLRERGEPGL